MSISDRSVRSQGESPNAESGHSRHRSFSSRNSKLYYTSEEAQLALHRKFLDYFLVLGRGNIGLPKGQAAPPIEAPSRSRFANLPFQPRIIDKFPAKDSIRLPFEASLPTLPFFVFPKGLSVSENQELPVFHHFVLTSANGTRLYAVALIFYEKLEPLKTLSLISEMRGYIKEMRRSNAQKFEQLKSSLPSWLRQENSSPISPRSYSEIYSPIAFVGVSTFPFFDTILHVLKSLYRISISESPLPIERFVSNVIHEVPVPPRGRIEVQFSCGDNVITISRPMPNELPLIDVDVAKVFQLLSLDNVLAVFLSMICEQKIIFSSSSVSVLTIVAETMTSFLFPFQWQGVYMPLLPYTLMEMLHAPVPYIAGILNSYISRSFNSLPNDVVLVDLDRDQIFLSKKIRLPSPPEKDWNKLKQHLKNINNLQNRSVNIEKQLSNTGKILKLNSILEENHIGMADLAFLQKDEFRPINAHEFTTISGMKISNLNMNRTVRSRPAQKSTSRFSRKATQEPKPQTQSETSTKSSEYRNGFLRFFVKLLVDYRKYILNSPSKENSTDELFNKGKFIGDSPESSKPILRCLTETQMFEQFIEQRTYFNQNMNAKEAYEVRFFDECVIAKHNRSKMNVMKASTPFLDDESFAISETFVCPFPNTRGIEEGEIFTHSPFVSMNESRFGNIRRVDPLLTEEEEEQIQLSLNLVEKTQFKYAEIIGEITKEMNIAEIRSSWEGVEIRAIVLQSFFAMYKERKNLRRTKDASVFIALRINDYNLNTLQQRKFKDLVNACKILQPLLHSYIEKRMRVLKIMIFNAKTIQSVLKSVLLRDKFTRIVNCTYLFQAFLKGFLFRKRILKIRRAANFVSYKIEVVNTNLQYNIYLMYVRKIQSICRGNLSRKKILVDLKAKKKTYQEEIFRLWDELEVPVIYRSVFLDEFKNVSFLSTAIYSEEVERLNQVRVSKNKRNPDQKKSSIVSDYQQDIDILYRILKSSVPQDIKVKLFEKAGIKIKSKTRKKRLLGLLWSNSIQWQLSCSLVLEILEYDDNKGTKVFALAQKSKRISENLGYTVRNLLKSMLRSQECIERQARQIKNSQSDIEYHKSELLHLNERLTRQYQMNSELVGRLDRLHTENLMNTLDLYSFAKT